MAKIIISFVIEVSVVTIIHEKGCFCEENVVPLFVENERRKR